MKDLIKGTFCDIYLRVTGKDYHFGNKYVDKLLDTFIKKLPNNIDEDFIWNFTLYQFAHYDNLNTRFDRVYVNWIYGDNARRRWKERTEQRMYYVDRFREKYGISKEIKPVSIKEYNQAERIRYGSIANMQLNHCFLNELIEGCDMTECVNYSDCREINKLK